MAKKQMLFKTKGMNRDLSVSAFNPEFSFENMNLRLSTNEHNTLMSWVNERGTAQMVEIADNEEVPISIPGTPIGTAVLNHKLIIFTTDTDKDYIYEFEVADKDNHALTSKNLYQGKLNFDGEHPLETLTSYESLEAQKIYWTELNNQPRVINIAKYESDPRIYGGNAIDTIFDFVTSVILDETVTIIKNTQASGTFAPGVIQYCLAYFNKYMQQTNIIYVSPLYYLAHQDRGASPEEKVSCSFTIRVDDIDENFDYLRLYSVQRTSLNADPIVRIVADLKVANATIDSVTNKKYLTFIDSGIYGTAMDPTELLFIGGKTIKALTMAEKDQTLFLGNIKQEAIDINKIQDYFYSHDNTPNFELTKECSFEDTSTFYPYKNSIGANNNNEQITTFKGGDYYRFGIQLQKKTGEWSEPIYLGDRQNTFYPQVSPILSEKTYQLSQARKAIDFSDLEENIDVSLEDYIKVRPVVVFPSLADRNVICQGVLNPTVFNADDRKDKYIYSQPSWFFRPYTDDPEQSGEGENVKIATNAVYTHYDSLPSHDSIKLLETTPSTPALINLARNIEIQGAKDKYVGIAQGVTYPTVWGSDNNAKTNSQYFVDQSIVTLNSPEIDFDSNVQVSSLDGLKLRIVGFIDVDSVSSSHIITTSSNKSLTGQNLVLDDDPGMPVSHISGEGETITNVLYNVGEGKEKGSRMIAGNIWNDGFSLDANGDENLQYMIRSDDDYYKNGQNFETEGDGDIYSTHAWPVNFFIHPWHASRSLNNDWGAGGQRHSMLKTKRMANLLYSYKTNYLQYPLGDYYNYNNINAKLHLQENEQVYKIGLPKQKNTTSDISYYPNIDKVLYNLDSYYPLYETCSLPIGKGYGYDLILDNDGETQMICPVSDSVEMKYKSTSHAIIALNTSSDFPDRIEILPSLKIRYGIGDSDFKEYGVFHTNYPDEGTYTEGAPFWGDTDVKFYQRQISLFKHGDIWEYDWEHKRPKILWLGELYREFSPDNLFGGNTREAIKGNTWLIGGEAVAINRNGSTNLVWSQGDTYYQRYDCLKTYPFTNEDKNQMIEILSFMCETHINLDGRYDANRGHINNVNVNPQNFNLINSVYSQLNNFFTSRQISSESVQPDYPNVIVYSKTKSSASDVDAWTNITLASTLELDGSKGQITSLNRFNDQIIAFQDRAISQVLYNENVQISSTQGVPIEIANSGKVQGKRYLSDFIGCSNKWSVVRTPAGIYFMDSNNKGIYMFDGTVKNLSGTLGFNTWCKNNISINKNMWNPEAFNDFVSYYDAQNQEVLFINKETCLAYSEKLGAFTSFYSYENTPYFCNLDDLGIWIKHYRDSNSTNSYLYHHQAGDYGMFFNKEEPYWMTLVGNPEPQMDKIFTNLEFRASVEGEGPDPGESESNFEPFIPFDNLETWDEYQHGIANMSYSKHCFKHHTSDNNAGLNRKFRIWRCDIPRDNYEFLSYPEQEEGETAEHYQNRVNEYKEWLQSEHDKGIFRTGKHPMDRMRNPWLYIKLYKSEAGYRTNLRRTEIHDVVMTYHG